MNVPNSNSTYLTLTSDKISNTFQWKNVVRPKNSAILVCCLVKSWHHLKDFIIIVRMSNEICTTQSWLRVLVVFFFVLLWNRNRWHWNWSKATTDCCTTNGEVKKMLNEINIYNTKQYYTAIQWQSECNVYIYDECGTSFVYFFFCFSFSFLLNLFRPGERGGAQQRTTELKKKIEEKPYYLRNKICAILNVCMFFSYFYSICQG